MPTQPPIPPLLQPYLSPSPSSLTLLTSTLGASTNWLLLRFIHAALKPQKKKEDSTDGEKSEQHPSKQNTSILILVSWLRDAAFWKEGGRRIGIDPQRICVVDALSTSLGILPHPSISMVEKTILEAIETMRGKDGGDNILLALDGLDFFLAASAVLALDVLDMLLGFRELVHGTIVTAAADAPLVQTPTSPLEVSHLALLIGLGHQANWVMGVRELDTGVAKDVSGVLRITKGAGCWGEGQEDAEEVMEAKECLYFVGGDGSVRVFERGA